MSEFEIGFMFTRNFISNCGHANNIEHKIYVATRHFRMKTQHAYPGRYAATREEPTVYLFVVQTKPGRRCIMIHADNLTFSYDYAGAPSHALDEVSLSVKPGELVAILGHNGCGKSTLAKHLNALLPVQSGTLTVAGLDAADPANQCELRRKVGMVFQNPDNQFVSTIIEEDVAFGLRNYDVPEEMIEAKVKEALHTVGMDGYEQRSPHSLSGGQKQRIALAGVLAIDPEILVFDEVTSMLDPAGSREVLAVIKELHQRGKTIVMITHDVEEALGADRVVLMRDGKVLATGAPREILTDMDLLKETRLKPPMTVQLYYELKAHGIELDCCPLSNAELTEALLRPYKSSDTQAALFQTQSSSQYAKTCEGHDSVTVSPQKGGGA